MTDMSRFQNISGNSSPSPKDERSEDTRARQGGVGQESAVDPAPLGPSRVPMHEQGTQAGFPLWVAEVAEMLSVSAGDVLRICSCLEDCSFGCKVHLIREIRLCTSVSLGTASFAASFILNNLGVDHG